MRIASSLVLALGLAGLAAACGPTNSTRQVQAMPPTVSYAVAGNDLSQANANAAAYCRQYGMGVVFQGVVQRGSENVASYACNGQVSAVVPSQVPATVVAPVPSTVVTAPPGSVVVAPRY